MPALERSFQVDCSNAAAFSLTETALEESGIHVKSSDQQTGVVIAKTGWNLMTFGNTLVVTVETGEPDSSPTTDIAVNSATNTFQLTDWGTNKRLIDKFETNLRRLVGEYRAKTSV